MSDLRALIERVEGLTKASDEIDALVLCALLAPAGSKVEQSRFNGVWCIYEPRTHHRPGQEPFRLWEGSLLAVRNPTGSLDAAVALCERCLPGREWSAGNFNAALPMPWAKVRVAPLQSIGDSAPTPAIALVLATLRAIEASKGGRHG